MRKVKNPLKEIDGYNCFGCSPDNPWGLKMDFYEDGDCIFSDWQPKDNYQGYHNILHGGIQSTLMDEIASWYVFARLKTAGVTTKINVKFLKPVYTNKGNIKLKASLHEFKRRIANIDVKLYDHEGVLCSEGRIQYFAFPEKYAKAQLYYPDFDSFFE